MRPGAAAGWAVVVGGVLPLALGATLGSGASQEGAGTWAAPMTAGAFLALSAGLALSHALVLLAYTSVPRLGTGTTTATTARAAAAGAAGSAALAACELWSGALARAELGSPVLGALEVAFATSSSVVLVGTLVLAGGLRRTRSALALPVLVNGLVLLVAAPLKTFGDDLLGILALTVWSLTYVWWGLALRRAALAEVSRARATAQSSGSGTA